MNTSFKVGDKVYFGRSHGEQTLAEVIKVNPKKLKVRTLETRGYGRGSAPGATWTVPPSMCRMADGSQPMPVAPVAAPIERAAFQVAFQVGDKAIMGSPNGEKTLVEVVKVNPARYQVKILAARGMHPAGTIYNCQPFGLTPVSADVVVPPPPPPAPKRSENEIMYKISACYSGLSPENLYCDGERSRSAAARVAASLNRELRALFIELGRRVSEHEAFEYTEKNPPTFEGGALYRRPLFPMTPTREGWEGATPDPTGG